MPDIGQYHRAEERLRERLRELNPDHPALKRIYFSTWKAIEAYTEAICIPAEPRERRETKMHIVVLVKLSDKWYDQTVSNEKNPNWKSLLLDPITTALRGKGKALDLHYVKISDGMGWPSQ